MNNYRACGVYSSKPRADVYCVRLNSNISKLVSSGALFTCDAWGDNLTYYSAKFISTRIRMRLDALRALTRASLRVHVLGTKYKNN